jgi:hypothetical protein
MSICVATSWWVLVSPGCAQAYRQAAKRLHPDKARAEGVTKEAAESAFHDLAEAYEVLLQPVGRFIISLSLRPVFEQCCFGQAAVPLQQCRCNSLLMHAAGAVRRG